MDTNFKNQIEQDIIWACQIINLNKPSQPHFIKSLKYYFKREIERLTITKLSSEWMG